MVPAFLFLFLFVFIIPLRSISASSKASEELRSLPIRKAVSSAYFDALQMQNSTVKKNSTLITTGEGKQTARPTSPVKSPPKPVVPVKCPPRLIYPSFKTDRRCMNKSLYACLSGVTNRTVWPVRVLSTFTAPLLSPVNTTGIVFYVYSSDRCARGSLYMDQLRINLISILDKDPNVSLSPAFNARPTQPS